MIHFIMCVTSTVEMSLLCWGGLSRPPTYIQTQVFSRLLIIKSSFPVDMALVCYLHLCSQWYIVVHVDLVNFLSQCR